MQKIGITASVMMAVAIGGCGGTAPLKKADAPTGQRLPPTQWGQPFASAGMELALEERGATIVNGKQAVSYGFIANGYPKGKRYLLWARNLAGEVILLDQLDVDASGTLVSDQGRPLVRGTFNFYSLHRGEPIDFALVSQDQSIRAFTRVVPLPLQARGNNGCALKLEMLSPGGKQFGIVSTGFKPNEEVSTMSTIDGQVRQEKVKASATGNFSTVIDTGSVDKSGGTASYLASGKSCKVELRYDWGAAIKTS